MKFNNLGSTDMRVSNFGLGASAFGRAYGEVNDDECIEVVKMALECGVNFIDSAPWYGGGKSEEVLGMILPQLPRSSFYMNTKIGRYGSKFETMVFDFSAERTVRSVDESLQRLGLDYVDVIQVHDIEFSPSLELIATQTLPALQKVKESGKARYIGITGYPIEELKKLIDMSPVKIDTVLSYCHGSMNDNTLQDHMQYFMDKNIGVINASGMSMGLLTECGPADWHPACSSIRDACRHAATYCKERGTNISRLAVHFCLSLPNISSTLFSTARMKEFEVNIKVAEDGITEEEEQIMAEVIERYFDPLEPKHWDGVELEMYWKRMAQEGKK